MAKRGRSAILDEAKQRELCAMVTLGCSRNAAAKYVGCTAATVRNTLVRDEAFAARMRTAEFNSEAIPLKAIMNAGNKSWRAAAWLLERLYPEQYARRSAYSVTREETSTLLAQIGECLGETLPGPLREKAFQRLFKVLTKWNVESEQERAKRLAVFCSMGEPLRRARRASVGRANKKPQDRRPLEGARSESL
ncbi:MAG: hypothetical protein ACYC35_26565 [Pirellulales bacterium]